MKKFTFFLIIFLIMGSNSMFGQINQIQQDDYCLFGFISEDESDYFDAIDYVATLGVTVLSNCDEEKLIFVLLNEEYRDYTSLFKEIEKHYNGICYYKSQENKIPRYPKCSDRYIKANLKN